MGPWLLGALVLVVAGNTQEGRRTIRKAAKEVIRLGYGAADKGSELVSEVKEQVSDLVEEVKAEKGEEPNGKPKTKAKSKAISNSAE